MKLVYFIKLIAFVLFSSLALQIQANNLNVMGDVSHLGENNFELVSGAKKYNIHTLNCSYQIIENQQARLEVTNPYNKIKGKIYFNNATCDVSLVQTKSKSIVSQSDIFTRAFTTSRADLYPDTHAKKPSAALLFNESSKAIEKNKLACQAFTKLKPNSSLDAQKSNDYVVTRLIMKQRISDQVSDCDYILENYDYQKAEQELKTANSDLDKLVGPILVVYLPNQSQFSYLVDLSNFNNQELEKMMSNWASLINSSVNTQTASSTPEVANQNQTSLSSQSKFSLSQLPFFSSLFEKIRLISNVVSCSGGGITYIISPTLGDSFKSICKITSRKA